MNDSELFIRREKATVEKMIRMYCRHHHHTDDLCLQCASLRDYVNDRVDHCVFGTDKVNCENCPVHCYKPDRREEIRKVMRYAGPRMILWHPVDAVRHIFRKRQDKIKVKELRIHVRS